MIKKIRDAKSKLSLHVECVYLYTIHMGRLDKIPAAKLAQLQDRFTSLSGPATPIRYKNPESLDLVNRLVAEKFYNYQKKAEVIDKKAAAALALLGVTATALFLSPQFTNNISGFNQLMVLLMFLIAAVLLFSTLIDRKFAEPSIRQIVDDCPDGDINQVKREIIRMYYDCDKRNARLLRQKVSFYNTTLYIAVFLLGLSIFSLIQVSNSVYDKNLPTEIVGVVILVVLCVEALRKLDTRR